MLEMLIHRPPHIILKRLLQNRPRFRRIHHHMMLKTIAANVLHQFLKICHFCNCPIAKCTEGVVGQIAFAKIGFDNAFCIVGTQSPEGQRHRGSMSIECAVGVFDAEA